MLLDRIAVTSRRVSEERSRLAKIRELAACIAAFAPDEVPIGVAYLSGELPQGKIGVGWASIRDTLGDGGATEASLGLAEVHACFDRIVAEKGSGSAGRKLETLRALFRRATDAEQEFLRRLLIGELRQGAQEGVIAEAIAKAASVPASDVRRALMLHGSAGEVAAAALARGAAGLAEFRLELMRPIQPMLAQTAEDTGAALAALERMALEHKLDGARVQVHRMGDDVAVFSRQQNDVTAAVPELVRTVRALPARQLVLDGETIALRPDGTPHPFQLTMRRFGRRLNVAALSEELPLSSFHFDILHADGEDLIDRPASERFELLAELVPERERVPRIVTASPEEARAFLDGAIAAGHEGVMAKSLAASYEAGRRGASWLKIKPSHTLDLVVLAIEQGSGRRSRWLSNIHLGARDPATGGFVMLGKTFKGMTDAMLEWQTQRFTELAIGREGHVVHVRPEQVVEVAFDGVQASPHYPAGLALRFARVKRYRSDKTAAEADTIDTVRAIHARSAGSDTSR
jgi:DNA ligase-1